jgi:hypothetical protein
MAGRPTFTLTAMDVDIFISPDGGGGIATGSGAIIVSEFSVTFRANDFSEASISLGYKTEAGLKKLQSLFPREGEGAYFSIVSITLKDGGPLSYLRVGGKPFFRGFGVGFSHKKQAGNIAFIINAHGGPYTLGQTLMAAPGMHPSSPESWGVGAYQSLSDSAEARVASAGVFLATLQAATSPFGAFKLAVATMAKQWAAPAGVGSNVVFLAAQKAYGFGSNTELKILEEIGRIVDLSPATNSLFETATKQAALFDLVNQLLQGGNLTFWDFLLGVLDTYGLDILCVGDKSFITPKTPLGDAVKANKIPASDLTYTDIRDFPFESPTRCIVTSRETVTSDTAESLESIETGVYPPDAEPTGQEAKTGVKAFRVDVPAWMAEVLKANRVLLSDKALVASKQAGKVAREDVKKVVMESNKAIGEAQAASGLLFNDYAQYMLMKRKFRQRTGVVMLKFSPYLLPGFPGEIEDPISIGGKPIATIQCMFLEVTHSVSYTGGTASSQVTFSHARYGGELSDEKLKSNPIYPGYSPESGAKAVSKEAFGV